MRSRRKTDPAVEVCADLGVHWRREREIAIKAREGKATIEDYMSLSYSEAGARWMVDQSAEGAPWDITECSQHTIHVRHQKAAECPWNPARLAKLLHDATPTARELEGRPNILDVSNGAPDVADPRKAREAKIRRNRAIHELTDMYRGAEKAGQLGRLPFDIRFVVEDLKRANGGKLPKPRIGRPRDRYHDLRRILIYLKTQDQLAARKPAPRKLQETLKAIAKNLGITSEETGGITIKSISYAEIREIYYDRSAKFQDAIKATVWMRERGAATPDDLS